MPMRCPAAPFLVASRTSGGCGRSRVLLDMSHVVPELVPDWIRTFRSMAAGERAFGNDTIKVLALNTRSVIASSYRAVSEAALEVARQVRLLDGSR